MLNDDFILPYTLAGLLYCPAIKAHEIIKKILVKACPGLRSLTFCLEDAVADEALLLAETNLIEALKEYQWQIKAKAIFPMLFVRVRSPEHLRSFHRKLDNQSELITGYILPKFDLTNAAAYVGGIEEFNRSGNSPLYMMPILESRSIADIKGRENTLDSIKTILDSIAQNVLNVRVGGNDFCNLYGIRRSVRETIYDIGVVRDILIDIINVFSHDYVVSGPVWEFFGDENTTAWREGLRRELSLDRLNGFIGKTCIHPSQLPVIYDSLKVSRVDLDDAKKILSWSSNELGVEKNVTGSRMNEVKCHKKWAKRIVTLGNIYGTREE